MNQNKHIFEEMRYFLMFYQNLSSMVCWTFVLFILSNFSFLSMGFSFSELLKNCFQAQKVWSSCKIHMQSYTNQWQRMIAYKVQRNIMQFSNSSGKTKAYWLKTEVVLLMLAQLQKLVMLQLSSIPNLATVEILLLSVEKQ